ncbi:MAG TPA: MAPEG family protein [Myxococcota bacterium]|jgi:hypothetical protein
MKDHSLIYPMFAMVLLTFSTLVRLFRTRVRFVREGAVNPAYFKTYQNGSEPEASAKLARHFVNLFEAPTLFYVACVSAMVTGQATTLVIGLAWLYVALRCAHTYIHTGSNQLQHRIAAYFSSWAVLLLLWICIVTGVALAQG